MRHRLSSLVALFLGVFALQALAADETSQSSVEQALNQRLGAIHSLQAAFTQTTVDADNRRLQTSIGHLWVDRPSRFRIETTRPSVQTLVSNGVDFWSWDADLEQVIVKKLDADVKQVPILLFGGNTKKVTSEYEITGQEQGDKARYTLHARSTSSLFESLAIEFDKGVPSTISIADSLGQRTRIQLSGVIINQPIADSHFQFTPPKGADVIDDRNAH